MRNGMFAKCELQWAVMAAVAAVGVVSNASAAVVFQDTFGASTINQTSTPSGGNSTSYDIGSARAATSTIASGDLNITQAVSSSTIAQAQAVFSATPITLASANDFIELTVTFTTSGGKSATALPPQAYRRPPTLACTTQAAVFQTLI